MALPRGGSSVRRSRGKFGHALCNHEMPTTGHTGLHWTRAGDGRVRAARPANIPDAVLCLRIGARVVSSNGLAEWEQSSGSWPCGQCYQPSAHAAYSRGVAVAR